MEINREKLDRSILILQLAVNLFENKDTLIYEDRLLLAELAKHSVVRNALKVDTEKVKVDE